MGESLEHRRLKEILEGKLKDWFGAAINEYYSDGHELDVYAVTSLGISIYIEIIWSHTKNHFLSDIVILQRSHADVKAVVASPDVLADQSMEREYTKTAISERAKGTQMLEQMLDGKRILALDAEYIDSTLRSMLERNIRFAYLYPVPASEKAAKEQQLQDIRDSFISKSNILFAISLFAVLYAVFRPIWFLIGTPSTGLFDSYTFLSSIGVMVVLAIVLGLGDTSTYELHLPWRRILPFVTIGLALESLSILSLVLTAASYPVNFRDLVLNYWYQLLVLSLFSLTIAFLASLVLEGYLPMYLRKILDADPEKSLKIKTSSTELRRFRPFTRLAARRRFLGIALILSLLLPVLAIQFDTNLHVFTPGISVTSEQSYLKNNQPGISVGYLMDINGSFSNNYGIGEGSCIANLYEPAGQNITLTAPALSYRSIEEVNLSNPSPIATENLTIAPSQSVFGASQSWQTLSINNPDDLRVSVVKQNNTIDHLAVSLAGKPPASKTNLDLFYYVKPTSQTAITCVEKRITMSLGNSSVEYVRHDFNITNKSNFPVLLDRIQLTDFDRGENQTSLTFRLNGTELQFVSRQNQNLYPNIDVLPSRTLNYSVSWITTY
jgi:hypothetical protein